MLASYDGGLIESPCAPETIFSRTLPSIGLELDLADLPGRADFFPLLYLLCILQVVCDLYSTAIVWMDGRKDRQMQIDRIAFFFHQGKTISSFDQTSVRFWACVVLSL